MVKKRINTAGFDLDRVDYEKEHLFDEWFGKNIKVFPKPDIAQEEKNIREFIKKRKKHGG